MLGTKYVGKKRVMSERQTVAWRRNWAIRQLRAFFHLVPPAVSEEARWHIQAIVDSEIMRFGAESEITRERKRQQALEEDE